MDHKRIGVMYSLLGLVMLLRGFSDALLMRSHLAFAGGAGQGYLPPDHYDQIFSAHGAIMIFFVAMPLIVGLMNLVVPLQLGVRDVAFPTLNLVSFWLTAHRGPPDQPQPVHRQLRAHRLAVYPPLSELQFSPDVGVDYYLWSVQIAGVGTVLSAVNLVDDHPQDPRPGHELQSHAGVLLDRAGRQPQHPGGVPRPDGDLGDADARPLPRVPLLHQRRRRQRHDVRQPHLDLGPSGGLHPGPARFRRLFRSRLHLLGQAVVRLPHHGHRHHGHLRTVLHGLAAPLLHHGRQRRRQRLLRHHDHDHRGADRGQGVQLALHDVRRAVRFTVPMLWAVGFMVTFVIGGMTGVLLAVPPVDFQLHNSLFLIAHFHNVIIGGVVFGIFAGYTYWFPKAFGFRLHEGLGKAAFWCWFVGFYLAFMPLYVLGLMGATRRIQHYDDLSWRPYMLAALAGALLILCGVLFQAAQLVVSIRDRERLRDTTGDPWDGRSLEWATTSPPPAFNFAVLPDVRGGEAYWDIKQRAIAQQALAAEPLYQAIEMPRNTAIGFVIAFCASFAGFALIWRNLVVGRSRDLGRLHRPRGLRLATRG